MATDKTFLDDQESLRALINTMPADEQAEYRSYGALALESAFPGRKMVVYTLRGGKPAEVEILTFEALLVDWETGPNFSVEGSGGKTQFLAVPRRYRPRDLFLHVPQNFTLKYKGRRKADTGVDFVSHYAVLIKTRSKDIHQVEGHTYCVTLNRFRERFPDQKIRY
jgi:hypothetical protein